MLIGELLCAPPVSIPFSAQAHGARCVHHALAMAYSAFKDDRHLVAWIMEVLLRYVRVICFQFMLGDTILGGQIRSLMCNNHSMEKVKPYVDLLGLSADPNDSALLLCLHILLDRNSHWSLFFSVLCFQERMPILRELLACVESMIHCVT